MRVSSSWQFAGSAWLLSTAVLLWLGIFLLCWPLSGSEVSAAFTVAGAPQAEQAVNGYGHQIDGNYFVLFAAENEAKDKRPRNATLLRTLVLVLFFGTALRWLGVFSGWIRCRAEVCSPIRCWFHSMVHLRHRRAVATLLGVFRL